MSGANLPAILANKGLPSAWPVDAVEQKYLRKAAMLYQDEYYEESLLALWNAAVTNLRRRVEAYNIELFESVVKDLPGRKTVKKDGATLVERWSGVDDLLILQGAARLGLITAKARKILETIDWMRNHASAAHPTDEEVDANDVIAQVLQLEANLFKCPMPEPGHSVSSLFKPVKKKTLNGSGLEAIRDQIRALSIADLRTAFAFMLDLLTSGEQPGADNAVELLPLVWEKAGDDVRKTAGEAYHSLWVDAAADKDARTRLLEFIVSVKGVKFIPDGARASLYRRAAKKLAAGKDTSYGWRAEEAAARQFKQLGPHVPVIAFEDVYQELLASWCGNYWGRSTAYQSLSEFVDTLQTSGLRRIVELFASNTRVREELFNAKPKQHAQL